MRDPQDPTASPSSPRTPRAPRGLLPPELLEYLVPSLQTGGLAAGTGIVFGIAGGIIADVNPLLNSISYGITWFTLGSSFWLTRMAVINSWGGPGSLTPRDKTKASAIAGGTAGVAGGLIRSPRLILPSAVIMTVLGGGGQGIVNKVAEMREEMRRTKSNEDGPAWMRSKYSPMKKLTDQEYEDIMEEKKLKLDTEIALIDDKIAELKAKAAAEKAKAGEQRAVAPIVMPGSEIEKPEEASKMESGASKKTSKPWKWI